MKKNLTEILMEAAKTDKGIHFIVSMEKRRFVTYQELLKNAMTMLAFLQDKGIGAGDEVILQLEDNEQILTAIWGCILGGMIPIPLSAGNSKEQRMRVVRILDKLKHPCIILSKEIEKYEKENADECENKSVSCKLNRIIFIEDVVKMDIEPKLHVAKSKDTAMIMYSSGSTGNPKGVVITHENMMCNEELIDYYQLTNADNALNWMPLTHMVGISFGHLIPMMAGMNQYFTSKELFLTKPIQWMSLLGKYSITITLLPNFALKHILSKMENGVAFDYDLCSIRLIGCAGEAISNKIVDSFLDAFEKYGLHREAIAAIYGITETQAIVSERLGKGVHVVKLDRRYLAIEDKVTVPEDILHGVTYVCLGNVIGRNQIRICNQDNEVLESGRVGYVQVKGDGVTPGYYQDVEQTNYNFSNDGWFMTGDIGVILNERLTLLGRSQEVVIVNAVNYYLNDIEAVAREVEGVSEENCIACRITKGIGEEEVIIVVTPDKSGMDLDDVSKEIINTIRKRMGLTIRGVFILDNIPRTSTGKVERVKVKELIESENFSNKLISTDMSNHTDSKIALKELEEKLEHIWKQVLGTEDIDRTKSFFELGGQSIHVYSMLDLVSEELGVLLNARSVFRGQSVKELALTISKNLENE